MNTLMEREQLYDIALKEEAKRRWIQSQRDEDAPISEQKRAKAIMGKAIWSELTEKQRQYVVAYYGGMKMDAIAKAVGVNKSTVSRTILRAHRRLRHVLKYCGPQLLRAALEEGESHGI